VRESDGQFGAQLEYFSDCILRDRDPEPSGIEGLADIRIVPAILESVEKRKPVQLPPFERHARRTQRRQFKKAAVRSRGDRQRLPYGRGSEDGRGSETEPRV
jgi:hypothetical protein